MVKKERALESNSIIDTTEVYFEKEIRTTSFHVLNDKPPEIAIADFLESNKVRLIMYGLDELRPEIFELFQNQIKELSLKLLIAKIIIASRPNYVKSLYSNFTYYQVNELSYDQMTLIASLWLKEPRKFLNELEKKSYFELANRPLFLSFLILLFKNNTTDNSNEVLPKYSKDVYRQIIDLLLAKWDKERSIKRASLYSYFDNQKKFEFLSDLAYNLTYIIKEKIFSHEDFKKAYLNIHQKFDLPFNQGEQVAYEIENHTGIIIKSLYDKYEFSHLAIQEFLCANYIVNAPFDEKIQNYIREYPVPLAVAVSLSSDSSIWFYELVLKIGITINDTSKLTQLCSQLLDRLYIEAPYFSKHVKLGIAFMVMCRYCDCTNNNFVSNFNKFYFHNSNVKQSIEDVLKNYGGALLDNSKNKLTFKRKFHQLESFFPEVLCLPSDDF